MKPIKYKCDFCGEDIIRRPGPKLHFCDIRCKSEYQRTFKPVSKEWLFDHYINKGMDTTQIAYMVNRDPKSVWNWLKDFDIPTRPRGGKTSPGSFKKGNISPTTGTHRPEYIKEILREVRKQNPTLPHLIGKPHYLKGKRGSETPNWKGGCTPERQKIYGSLKWKKRVVEVWSRDNATCQKCGMHKGTNRDVKFDIHHIKPFYSKESRTDINNLILLCSPCHYWVHSNANTEKEFIHDDT